MSLPDNIASYLMEAGRDINPNICMCSHNYWMYTASVQLHVKLKRSFSGFRPIKTFLRSSMSIARLSGL